MGVKLCVYSFPQKGDRNPHRYPHYPTAHATRRPFLPHEQLFPKHRVLLGSNARSLIFPTHRASVGGELIADFKC